MFRLKASLHVLAAKTIIVFTRRIMDAFKVNARFGFPPSSRLAAPHLRLVVRRFTFPCVGGRLEGVNGDQPTGNFVRKHWEEIDVLPRSFGRRFNQPHLNGAQLMFREWSFRRNSQGCAITRQNTSCTSHFRKGYLQTLVQERRDTTFILMRMVKRSKGGWEVPETFNSYPLMFDS